MTEKAAVLITAPKKKDDPTYYTSQWADKAIKIANELGYKVISIKEKDTTYENVSKTLKENKINLYSHWGHGCTSSLQGNMECIVTRKYTADQLMCMAESPYIEERQKVLKLLNPLGQLSCPGICALDIDPCSASCTHETNVGLLKDTITIAVACHSCTGLGKCAIAYGARAYSGSDDLLMFPVDSKGSQDIFGDVQLTMFKELLLGHTVQEAEKVMSELEDSYIRQFIDTKYIALPLLWNKLHRKVLGDPRSMIYNLTLSDIDLSNRLYKSDSGLYLNNNFR
jgi:hypothetical protein